MHNKKATSLRYIILGILLIPSFCYPEITVRPYQERDHNAVLSIARQFQSELVLDNSCYQLSLILFNLNKIGVSALILTDKETHKESTVETPIGFIVFGPNPVKFGTSIKAIQDASHHDNLGEISYIALKKEYQNKGLSTRLFNAAKKQFIRQGHKGIYAWVNNHNHHAINWFKRLNFTQVTLFNTISIGDEFYRADGEAQGYVTMRLFFNEPQTHHIEQVNQLSGTQVYRLPDGLYDKLKQEATKRIERSKKDKVLAPLHTKEFRKFLAQKQIPITGSYKPYLERFYLVAAKSFYQAMHSPEAKSHLRDFLSKYIEGTSDLSLLEAQYLTYYLEYFLFNHTPTSHLSSIPTVPQIVLTMIGCWSWMLACRWLLQPHKKIA